MKIVVRASAKRDLREASAWYDNERLGLGQELVDEFETASRRLAEFPYTAAQAAPGVRKKILQRFPYSIFYTLEPGVLRIFAVLHHSRSEQVWRRRRA